MFVPAGVRPVVAATVPDDGATSVAVDAQLQVRFTVPIQAGSAVIKLVRTSDGSAVPGNNGTESQGSTATFVPANSLAPGTKYSLTVSGAVSSDGAKMSGSTTVSFTTSGAAACPCSLLQTTTQPSQGDSGDRDAVTLGLKFSPTTNGYIKGLRYWRDASNTGTHTGTLYSVERAAPRRPDVRRQRHRLADGERSRATCRSRPGTTYVAAYYAPTGTTRPTSTTSPAR